MRFLPKTQFIKPNSIPKTVKSICSATFMMLPQSVLFVINQFWIKLGVTKLK